MLDRLVESEIQSLGESCLACRMAEFLLCFGNDARYAGLRYAKLITYKLKRRNTSDVDTIAHR